MEAVVDQKMAELKSIGAALRQAQDRKDALIFESTNHVQGHG